MKPTLWRKTLLLWAFCFFKIPLLYWLKPRVIELNEQRGVIRMPFRRRSRNHVNSMYFGAISVGAELAAGIVVMYHFSKQKEKFTFLFKNFTAEFLKRCEEDVCFVFEEGDKVSQAIAEARRTQQRQNVLLNVTGKIGEEIVGHFTVTLSLKQMQSAKT